MKKGDLLIHKGNALIMGVIQKKYGKNVTIRYITEKNLIHNEVVYSIDEVYTYWEPWVKKS